MPDNTSNIKSTRTFRKIKRDYKLLWNSILLYWFSKFSYTWICRIHTWRIQRDNGVVCWVLAFNHASSCYQQIMLARATSKSS